MAIIDTKHRIIDIKITYRCNNLCRFCVAGDKRHSYPDQTPDNAKKILKEKRKQCDEVVFTGGEPNLHPDVLELVSFAKNELDYKIIQIQTNGKIFAYRDYCEKMIAAGATQFAISIHGHNQALHDYLTDQPKGFIATVAGIKNLIAMNQTVVTNTVITKPNYRHLPDIARLLIRLGLQQYMFAYPHIVGACEKNFASMAAPMTLVAPYVKKALAISDRANKISLTEAIPQCMLPGFENHIMERLHAKLTVVDNKENIEDFHGHRAKYMKQKGPNCPGCKWFQSCEGVWPDYPEYFGWKEFQPIT